MVRVTSMYGGPDFAWEFPKQEPGSSQLVGAKVELEEEEGKVALV